MEPEHLRPIFIGGMHRSGTTLLRVMLNRHSRLSSGPELQLLERTGFLEFHRYLDNTWLPRLEQEYGLDAQDLDRAMAAFMNNFLSRYQLQRGKERWVEKTPKNILRIDYLFRLFPHAQFIHMIRDPRDVHASVKAKSIRDTPRWSAIGAVQTASEWVRRINRGTAWRDELSRYREIQYEHFVRDPEGVMRQILTFLAEPWDSAVLEAPNTQQGASGANVRRPVFESSVGRWRENLTQDETRQIEAIAGPLMKSLGYATSQSTSDAGIGAV